MDEQEKHRKRRTALIALAVLAFAYFVYPTPYEYTRRAPNVFRVNRFTGVREVSTANGWRKSSSLNAPAPSIFDDP